VQCDDYQNAKDQDPPVNSGHVSYKGDQAASTGFRTTLPFLQCAIPAIAADSVKMIRSSHRRQRRHSSSATSRKKAKPAVTRTASA
jgi:hypothetical protein